MVECARTIETALWLHTFIVCGKHCVVFHIVQVIIFSFKLVDN